MKISNIEVPYAQIPNGVLFDPTLSWKAKGVWAYIQAKPNDWDFSSERMAGDSIDGVRATRSGIDELIEKGYLVARRLQSGRMEYSLTEKAISTKSHNAKTALCQNSTDNKERIITKKDTKQTTPAKPESDELFLSFWESYPKRKRDRELCRKKFLSFELELQRKIVEDVRTRRVKHTDWVKENGRFVCAPIVYLRGKRWEEEIDNAGLQKISNVHHNEPVAGKKSAAEKLKAKQEK